MAEYEACILGLRLAIDMGVQEILVLGDSDLFRSVEFRHIPRIHNEIADALATLASMLHHPDKTYVDPLHIQVRDQHAYYNVVEEELDGVPWFHDVKEYIKSGVYPVHAIGDQKRTIRRLASGFLLNGGNLVQEDSRSRTTKVHGDLIHSPPSELHTMSAPWPFVAWGMDVIGPIELAASNGHRFILVAIDYFAKWVKARYVNNSRLCINSTPYRPKPNGAVEAVNKNVKKILRKMVQGYRTTIRTSVGATPYLLVYGTEAVIPAEVEIPSLRIVAEAGIDDEWVKTRLEQLSLIDEKRLAAVCRGQLYQKRIARAYNKKAPTWRMREFISSFKSAQAPYLENE
ncbi:uncharacterized protein [Nicotiana tomentosiformis]|uniref:uncharacterized protein n=1 Tax=Nicotiana tomentosiformis TaxID=4098 RepID=UPI00388CBDB6